MTATTYDIESEQRQAAQRARRFRSHLVWWLCIAGAILIYELTADPVLGSVVACLKLGWDDCLTAQWLWRRDPDAARGWCCFWFYLAMGLWRISIAALVMMIVLALVATPGFGPQPHLKAVLVEAAIGFVLSSLATAVAVGIALRRHIRVWVDPIVSRARIEELWPPPYQRRNRAPIILNSALMTGVIVFVLAFGIFISQGGGAMMRAIVGPLADVVVVLFVLGVAMAMLLSERGLRRIVARTPEECWPLEESSPAEGLVAEPSISSEETVAEIQP